MPFPGGFLVPKLDLKLRFLEDDTNLGLPLCISSQHKEIW